MRWQCRYDAILSLGLSLVAAAGCIPDVEPTPTPSPPPTADCDELANTCGPAGDESCCASVTLPGGSYTRLDPADNVPRDTTVSSFQFDRFEVTVGRFRRFVEAYPGSKPQEGAGAHPAAGEISGWSPAWDSNLPPTQAELIAEVSTYCDDNFGGQGYPAWSDEPGAEENLPMNCLSWFVASAFCAWEGGRLPTEAEWNYAAAGGEEERSYPWGEGPPNPSLVVFQCTGDGSPPGDCAPSDVERAGSRSPNGDSRWGQADLAGSMFEWTMDVKAPYGAEPCVDCVAIDTGNTLHVVRGGAWFEVMVGDDVYLRTNARNQRGWTSILPDIGVRCVRDL